MGLMNDVPPPAVFLPMPLPAPDEPLVCSLSLLVEAARVRSIVLTGEWPEWSPELASSLLERRNPISPADVEAIENILTPRLTADDPAL